MRAVAARRARPFFGVVHQGNSEEEKPAIPGRTNIEDAQEAEAWIGERLGELVFDRSLVAESGPAHGDPAR